MSFKQINEALDNYLILNEKINPSIPEWLEKEITERNSRYKNNILKNFLNSKKIDLQNAYFTHSGLPRTPQQKSAINDPNRVSVFLMDGGHVYIPGYNEHDTALWDYKPYKYHSLKSIIDHAIDYGYFDLENPASSKLGKQKERSELKKGMISRGIGQYSSYSEYEKDNNGWDDHNKPVLSSRYWLTKKGQDKSGYIPNIARYKEMLNNVNLDNYERRLTSFRNRLVNLQEKLRNLITNYNIDDKDDPHSGSLSNFYGNAFALFDEAVKKYRRLLKAIDRAYEKESDKAELEKNIRAIFGNISYDSGSYYSDYNDAQEVRDAITKAEKYLREEG